MTVEVTYRNVRCECEAGAGMPVVLASDERCVMWSMDQGWFDRADFRPRTGMVFDLTVDIETGRVVGIANLREAVT